MFPNVPKQEQLADFIISDRGMVVKFNVPVLLLSKRKNWAVWKKIKAISNYKIFWQLSIKYYVNTFW